MSTDPEIHVFDSLDALSAATAERFVMQAKESVALSGGSTPKHLFGLLAREPYRSRVDWARLSIYWSDERCVPPDDPDSNYGMARDALLSDVPAVRVFRMHGEEDPAEAAADYESCLPADPIDLVLLGMGPDGHTASLFPHTAALAERNRRVAPNYVPKLNAWRITFTPLELRRAHHVIFLVGGADKAAVLKQVLQGPYDPDTYPSQLLREASGTVTWHLDRAAAAELDR